LGVAPPLSPGACLLFSPVAPPIRFKVYYFDVNAEHLPGALDRFAQFFIAPLFTEAATARELNAVDSVR
jgi:hypothetical protein